MNKKILLIFRDGYDAKYLVSNYASKNPNQNYLLVLESGSLARHKKLKKYFLNKSLLKKFISCLDIFALLIFNYFMMRKIISTLGEYEYPRNIEIEKVDDINNLDFKKLFDRFSPNIIFNYGTAIYKKTTLEKIALPLLNIHSGILPAYRNVHSDFWAYMNNDLGGIGVTIFTVDDGIDTGKIILQKTTNLNKNNSLSSIKIANLKAIYNLMNELTAKLNDGSALHGENQDEKLSRTFSSPNFMDLIRFLFRKPNI